MVTTTTSCCCIDPQKRHRAKRVFCLLKFFSKSIAFTNGDFIIFENKNPISSSISESLFSRTLKYCSLDLHIHIHKPEKNTAELLYRKLLYKLSVLSIIRFRQLRFFEPCALYKMVYILKCFHLILYIFFIKSDLCYKPYISLYFLLTINNVQSCCFLPYWRCFQPLDSRTKTHLMRIVHLEYRTSPNTLDLEIGSGLIIKPYLTDIILFSRNCKIPKLNGSVTDWKVVLKLSSNDLESKQFKELTPIVSRSNNYFPYLPERPWGSS